MHVALTGEAVRSLKPRRSRYECFDTKESLFAVRVNPTGTKTFYVFYRIRRHLIRHYLGKWPTTSLSQALAEAKRVKGRVLELRLNDNLLPTVEEIISIQPRLEKGLNDLAALLAARDKSEEERECLRELGSQLLQLRKAVSSLTREENHRPLQPYRRKVSTRPTNAKT